MQRRTILIAFDLASRGAGGRAYATAHDVIEFFGLKDYVSTYSRDIELPTTTIVGSLDAQPGFNAHLIRDELLFLFRNSEVPVTQLLVGFLDSFAGAGETLELNPRRSRAEPPTDQRIPEPP